MQETLEKILSILEAQDAKIKALEAQIEAMGGGVDTLIETIYCDKDDQMFNSFSEKHGSKFAPYVDVMDKLEGGNSLRSIYEKTKELDSTEGYTEDAYVDGVLANIIETINSLKAVVPPEAVEALENAEEAIVDAAVANDLGEGLMENAEEADGADPEEWSEEMLAKEKLEGRAIFE